MEILQPRQREAPSSCPYLEGREKCYEYFLAVGVTGRELAALLENGWRKFGIYFFRPVCPQCRACIPLRVPVARFIPSRSQRRVLRRGRNLSIRFGKPLAAPEVFEVYQRHSRRRFGEDSDWEDFLLQFYLPSCPGLQGEVRSGADLVGAGFLDVGSDGLSSVYFCFDPRYERFSPGTLGALAEIAEARRRGLDWYYLGYYVPGCSRMAYKDSFRPRQHYDWARSQWFDPDAQVPAPETVGAGDGTCGTN